MPKLKLIRLTCLFFAQFAEGSARNTIDVRKRRKTITSLRSDRNSTYRAISPSSDCRNKGD